MFNIRPIRIISDGFVLLLGKVLEQGQLRIEFIKLLSWEVFSQIAESLSS